MTRNASRSLRDFVPAGCDLPPAHFAYRHFSACRGGKELGEDRIVRTDGQGCNRKMWRPVRPDERKSVLLPAAKKGRLPKRRA